MNRLFLPTCLTACALLIASLCGCSTADFTSVADPSHDFTADETYSWKKDSLDRLVNVDTEFHDIQRSVEAQLEARGFQKVEDGGDLEVVALAGGSMEELGGRYELAVGGYYDPFYDSYYQTVYANPELVVRGHLVVDLIDNEDRTLVWRGYGTGVIADPNRAERKIPEIVARLFADFPVKPN